MKKASRLRLCVLALVILGIVAGGIVLAEHESYFFDINVKNPDGTEQSFASTMPIDTEWCEKHLSENPMIPDFDAALALGQVYVELGKSNGLVPEAYQIKFLMFDEKRELWFVCADEDMGHNLGAGLLIGFSMYDGRIVHFAWG